MTTYRTHIYFKWQAPHKNITLIQQFDSRQFRKVNNWGKVKSNT